MERIARIGGNLPRSRAPEGDSAGVGGDEVSIGGLGQAGHQRRQPASSMRSSASRLHRLSTCPTDFGTHVRCDETDIPLRVRAPGPGPLARQDPVELVTVQAIAEAQKNSPRFLEQILLALNRARYVRSLKGQHGGHQLARTPGRITLAEIIRLIDGALAPTDSVSESFYESTPIEKEKKLLGVYRRIRNLVSSPLADTPLADVCLPLFSVFDNSFDRQEKNDRKQDLPDHFPARRPRPRRRSRTGRPCRPPSLPGRGDRQRPTSFCRCSG